VAQGINLTNAIRDKAAAAGDATARFFQVSRIENNLADIIRGQNYGYLTQALKILQEDLARESERAIVPANAAARREIAGRRNQLQREIDQIQKALDAARQAETDRIKAVNDIITFSVPQITDSKSLKLVPPAQPFQPPTKKDIDTAIKRNKPNWIVVPAEPLLTPPPWTMPPGKPPGWLFTPPTTPPQWPTPEEVNKLLRSRTELEPQPQPSLAQTALETTGAAERPTDLIALTGIDEASARFQAALGGIGQTLIDGGATAGQYLTAGGEAAAAALQSQAGSIGSAIGSAAAAVISSARVAVSVPTVVASRPDAGAQKTD
jgi:hypothetical protein